MSKSTPLILQNVARLGLIKEYDFVLKIKSLHSNSAIYKPKKLHTKLNCSRTKIRRILAIIIEQGWGYYSKGHLVINSATTIHKLYSKKKRVSNYVEIKSKEDIHIELLKQKQRQQKFVKDKISDLNNSDGKGKRKAIKFLKGEKGFVSNEQLSGKIGTGLLTLSKVLNYSEGHTGYVLRCLEKKGLVRIERKKATFVSYMPFLKKDSLPCGYFLKGFSLFKKNTNAVIIPSL